MGEESCDNVKTREGAESLLKAGVICRRIPTEPANELLQLSLVDDGFLPIKAFHFENFRYRHSNPFRAS